MDLVDRWVCFTCGNCGLPSSSVSGACRSSWGFCIFLSQKCYFVHSGGNNCDPHSDLTVLPRHIHSDTPLSLEIVLDVIYRMPYKMLSATIYGKLGCRL